MGFNQLFIKKPTIEILEKILKCIGLNSINDETEFSKLDFVRLNSLVLFQEIKEEVSSFYLPCKKTIYFKTINDRTLITITRQFLKIFNYTLDSKEKYINSKKYIIYKIMTQVRRQEKKDNIDTKGKIVVNFD